jgi:hypothetical protein
MGELIESLPFWNNAHFVLFLWSTLCWVVGVLTAGLFYYYHIHFVIKRADKLIDRLRAANEEQDRRYGLHDRRINEP